MNSEAKAKTLRIASWVLAVGIIALMLYVIDAKKTYNVLKSINPVWFLPIILVYSIGWIIRGIKWQRILGRFKYKVSLQDAVGLTMIGNYIGLVIPAKLGDLSRVVGLKRKYNYPVVNSTSTVVFDRFLDFFAVLILTLGSFALLPNVKVHNWIYYSVISSCAACGIFVLMMYILIRKPKLIAKLLFGKLKRLLPLLEAVRESFFIMTHSISSLLEVTILSVVVWILEASIVYFLFLSLKIQISFSIAVFAIMVANLTKTLPITPQAIGVYEATMSGIFVYFGLPGNVGFTVSLIDHAIKNLYTFIVGSIFFVSWRKILSIDAIKNAEKRSHAKYTN